jgi:hypothetical protein
MITLKNPHHDYRTGDQMRGLLDLMIDLPDILRTYPMIEIGSNTGDSIQLFALFFRELYCIDAFLDDEFMRRTGNDIYTMFLEKTAGRNIKLLHCKSEHAFHPPFSNNLPHEAGFIYIDADHSYTAVLAAHRRERDSCRS